MPFIAHLKISDGQLAFVQEIKNGKVRYTLLEQKSIEEDFETFSIKLSGAVVVMEGGKESGEKEYRVKRQGEVLNRSLLPLGIFTLLAFAAHFLLLNGTTFIQSGYLFWGLLITKIVGFSSSVILVLHELKISTPLADKICGFSSKTDCDTVLSSNASKLFGWLNWADVGLIYFTGTFLFLSLAESVSSLWFLSLLSAMSLPYPFFSIYFQTFIAKKWCPFCLLVQIILITEFVLLLPVLIQVHFSVLNALLLSLSLLVSASLWLIWKDRINKMQEFNIARYSYLGLKRRPQVFRSLLTDNGYEDILITPDSLVLGNPEAPVTLTAFLSLYCGPCATAFKQLKELLDSCMEVKINVIFSVYNDDESIKLVNTLYFIYKNRGKEQALDFLYKWYTLPEHNRKTLYEQEQMPEGFDHVDTIRKENKLLFEKYKIPGTPTVFANGYQYPVQQYNYGDVKYYIDDIKQIIMESKRQEACTQCN